MLFINLSTKNIEKYKMEQFNGGFWRIELHDFTLGYKILVVDTFVNYVIYRGNDFPLQIRHGIVLHPQKYRISHHGDI